MGPARSPSIGASKTGIILDYDDAGNLLSIEVLDASRRVEEPRSVIFSTNG